MSASEAPDGPPVGVAFLLAQLGAHATARYAERVAKLELTPAHTGVLRLIARDPGQSQQALAAQLGVVPSKIVSLLDDLEHRELITRGRSAADRRHHAVTLTAEGRALMGRVRRVAGQHEADVTAALDDAQRAQLLDLLQRLADQQGLRPGVHPGYGRSRG